MSGRTPARAGGNGHRGRVLIIIENGPGTRDHRTVKQIGSLVEAGYQVGLITPRGPRDAVYRDHPRIRIFAYPPPYQPRGRLGYIVEYGYSVLAAAFLSVGAAARHRPDVVQFCEPPNIYFPLGWVFKMLGARVVVDQRDLLPELYAARYGSIQKQMLTVLRFLERRSFRGADGVLCVNDYLRERILGVSSDESLKRGHKYLCCWVGVMGLQDRVDLLLRSIDHLVHGLGRDDCEFAIIGTGEYLPTARALAQELDLGKWVEFTGQLDPDDVFRYLATADLGLDASLQIDVSPVKAMEYMAFGLPVVTFDLPETRVLTEGAAMYAKAGDVVGHACAINALLDDAERRREFGQAGRAKVWDEVAWDHQAAVYLKMINRLCASAARQYAP